eukprot:828275-Pyramimonas_sp.AAC.1
MERANTVRSTAKRGQCRPSTSCHCVRVYIFMPHRINSLAQTIIRIDKQEAPDKVTNLASQSHNDCQGPIMISTVLRECTIKTRIQ